VGLPVYQGADLIAKALDCLQRQTFKNFEAIISVDGNDTETAAACRPFLADSRFTMIVHPKRLDWVGNFNWLLQQDLKEFFCYRQHDDTTASEFFETLLRVADKERNAAAIYCDCKYSGESNHIEIARSIEGAPLERILEFIERIPRAQGPPIRGLMRSAAIRHAGLVRSDEFRAPVQIHGWLAKLLAWGHFRRVGEALYYRLDRPQSLTRHYTSGSEERKRAEWATMFTGLLEAVMPLCHTPDERLFFQQVILTRIVAYPNFGPYADFSSSAPLIAECLQRLKFEGNSRLLTEQELPAVLHGLKDRVDQIGLFDRSRIRRTLYQISQRARLARFLYPRSRMRRVNYRVRHLFKVLKRVLLAFALKIRF
jgi:glycosyltransferase involved in cell wall biosynthesis